MRHIHCQIRDFPGRFRCLESGDQCQVSNKPECPISWELTIGLSVARIYGQIPLTVCNRSEIVRFYHLLLAPDLRTHKGILVNSYPGAPGYVGPSSSVSKVAYTSLPDATYSPIFEFIPLAPNTREGCTMYVPGSDLQYNSTASSSCDIAGHYYSVSVKKLALWNPSLHLGSGSSNSTNTCSFSKSYRYCFRYPEASSTNVPGVGASTPLPSATKH